MYIPLATEPWSEIVAGLHQGGHDWRNPSSGELEDAIVDREFDVVFSMYQRDGHGPAEGVPHLYVRLPDGYLTDRQLDEFRALADLAHEQVTAGRRVLVRCQAGYNRSGLVVAFVLLRMGYMAWEAIGIVRARRSAWALCNEGFVAHIHAEEWRLAREADHG